MVWAHVNNNNGLILSMPLKNNKAYQEVNFDDYCKSVESRQSAVRFGDGVNEYELRDTDIN